MLARGIRIFLVALPQTYRIRIGTLTRPHGMLITAEKHWFQAGVMEPGIKIQKRPVQIQFYLDPVVCALGQAS